MHVWIQESKLERCGTQATGLVTHLGWVVYHMKKEIIVRLAVGLMTKARCQIPLQWNSPKHGTKVQLLTCCSASCTKTCEPQTAFTHVLQLSILARGLLVDVAHTLFFLLFRTIGPVSFHCFRKMPPSCHQRHSPGWILCCICHPGNGLCWLMMHSMCRAF